MKVFRKVFPNLKTAFEEGVYSLVMPLFKKGGTV